MSATESIRRYSKRLPRGKPIPTARFLRFGSRAAVDQALSRIVREGGLSRIGRGLFMRPKESPYVGELPPDISEVVKVLAKGAKVQVSGASAALQLGLSTQVPVRPVYLTDGPTRTIHVGKLGVLLKHVSPRKVALAGRPAGVALSAMWYLGKEELAPAKIEKIREQIPAEEFEALKRAMPSMPIWMQNTFIAYERDSGP